jgi:hypothetical protein
VQLEENLWERYRVAKELLEVAMQDKSSSGAFVFQVYLRLGESISDLTETFAEEMIQYRRLDMRMN